MNVKIDESRNALFDDLGRKRLEESYMADGEKSPQERFAFVASAFGSNEEHAQRLYDYASQHWLSFSTPILSFGRNKRGLPISCFLNKIPDTAEGLVKNLSETNWLSMLGGGVGVHVQIRGADEKSVGVMPHLKTYDASSLAYRQGKTRRGSYAAFLDISHPDIIQFLEMRKATGDQNQKALNLNHGVNIPDRFMQIIENCMQDPTANDDWELTQPNSGKVVEVVSAKYLWMKLLELRMHTGEPYIWFIDRANEGLPWYQREAGLGNYGSNICTEVSLATSEERTAVCCLSSVNLEYYDDWKDNKLFLPDILEMLDNVIEYFVKNAPDEIERARYSAMRERAVGVGALGFHAFLQKNMIAFESAIAKSVNLEMFKHIKTSLDKANYDLAVQRGACPDANEYGVMVRCSHVTAIAPNASSSIIMGNTSPSVEPYAANAYRQDTSSGAYINKNKFLAKIIEKESKTKVDPEVWYDEVWASIIADEGSVLNQDWMDEYTKDVFKTAKEIDQLWIIEHAADRQQFVDQSQSINTFFAPSVNVKRLHAVHFLAWKKGLKGLYYLRSSKLRTADKVGKRVQRNKIEDEIDMQSVLQAGCLACE